MILRKFITRVMSIAIMALAIVSGSFVSQAQSTSYPISQDDKENTQEVILPNNDRHQVENTTSGHYQAVGYADLGQNIATGVVIGENTVLTNKHVVNLSNGNMKFSPAATDASTYPQGTFEEKSAEPYPGNADLAVVHFEPNDSGQHVGDVVQPATIGDATQAQKGDDVTITGYPGDKELATMWESNGKIMSNGNGDMTYDASTYGGNSGSGVFNSSNELIGIHYGGVEGESNNAVPLSGDVLSFVNEHNQ